MAAIAGSCAAILEAVRDIDADTRVFVPASGAIFGEALESPQREDTPCRPTNPYAVAKLAAHQLVGALRANDGLHASSGIVYNHESERRPEQFVTRRITRAAAAISLGLQQELTLGLAERGARLVVRRRHHARRMADAPAGSPGRLRARERRAAHGGRASRAAAFACVGLDAERYVRVDPSLVRAAGADAERRRPEPRRASGSAGGRRWASRSWSSGWCRPTCARCGRARSARASVPVTPYTGGRMTTVGVIGLGYVGLPLAVAFAREGCEVVAVDVDSRKVEAIAAGESYVEDVSSRGAGGGRRAHSRDARATRDLAKADAVLICVPTPLTPNREPDLGPLIGRHARAGGGAAGRPAGGARVDDLSGHHARAGGAAARGVRAGGRARLPSGVLARAGGPRAHGLHAAQHAEGARRPDRGVRASARRSCTAWSATRSCVCRAPRRRS